MTILSKLTLSDKIKAAMLTSPEAKLRGKTPQKRRRAIAFASGRKNARVRSCAPWYYLATGVVSWIPHAKENTKSPKRRAQTNIHAAPTSVPLGPGSGNPSLYCIRRTPAFRSFVLAVVWSPLSLSAHFGAPWPNHGDVPRSSDLWL